MFLLKEKGKEDNSGWNFTKDETWNLLGGDKHALLPRIYIGERLGLAIMLDIQMSACSCPVAEATYLWNRENESRGDRHAIIRWLDQCLTETRTVQEAAH